MMNMRKPLAVGLAAAIVVGIALPLDASTPAVAAPVSSNTLALKEAVPGDVIPVHKRRSRRHGNAAFAGLAFGIISSIIAHEVYRKRYRDHYYAPYGYAPYGYAPYGYPPCIRRGGVLYCR